MAARLAYNLYLTTSLSPALDSMTITVSKIQAQKKAGSLPARFFEKLN
jgi:hypothetical protein